MILTTMSHVAGAQNYVTPEVVTTLSADADETSGLLRLGNELWTHNDSGDDALLYQVDLSDGDIIRTVEVVNAENVDWEDITHDDNYIYIGDIGNNDGSRTDLKIYRVARSDLAVNDEVSAEEITFYYSDQTSFEPNYHNTNFDCEALVHYQNNLYLFTKNWLDFKTNCYVLPKTIGSHEAVYQSSFDVSCLVSGATLVPSSGTLALIGYTTSGGSYTWLFNDFAGDDFFSGASTQLIWTILSQIEGVCDAGGQDIFISSEEFAGFIEPTLYYQNISGFLTGSIDITEPGISIFGKQGNIVIAPVQGGKLSGTARIYNTLGVLLKTTKLSGGSPQSVSMNGMKGTFIVILEYEGRYISRKIVLF